MKLANKALLDNNLKGQTDRSVIYILSVAKYLLKTRQMTRKNKSQVE